MALPSYREIAETIGVPRCRGIRDGFRCYEDHETGVVRDGFVHWRDRRVLREGIYNFLKLAATLTVVREPNEPDWQVRYRILRLVPQLAKQSHLRLPSALGANDRAELAAMLVNVPSRTPGREEALRWARR